MTNIVARYRKLIKKALLYISVLLFGSSYAEVPTYMVGVWEPSPYRNNEDIELCLTKDRVIYKWERTGEVMESGVANINQIDDVFVISFYKDRAILRKIVVLYREYGDDLSGHIHMYDGVAAFNYFPVSLVKKNSSCDISGNPVNH